MPIKKAPNSRGIPSANWSNDLAIYGPQGSQRRQDANEAYQSFSGSAIQRGPYTPDAEGQTEPMQLSAYTGNPYGSTEPKAKAPMTPSSAPMGMTSSGQAFDYSTGKFASQQPPQQSQKPELDRWTDLGVDASDYHNLKAGNVSPQQWNGIKQGAIQNNLDRFNHISRHALDQGIRRFVCSPARTHSQQQAGAGCH